MNIPETIEENDQNSPTTDLDSHSGELHVCTRDRDSNSSYRDRNSVYSEPNDSEYNASDESDAASEDNEYVINRNSHDVIFGPSIHRWSGNEYVVVDTDYEVGIDRNCGGVLLYFSVVCFCMLIVHLLLLLCALFCILRLFFILY